MFRAGGAGGATGAGGGAVTLATGAGGGGGGGIVTFTGGEGVTGTGSLILATGAWGGSGGGIVTFTGGGGVTGTGSLTLGVEATGGAVAFPVVMVTLAEAASEAASLSNTKVNVSPTTQSASEASRHGILRAAQSFMPSEAGHYNALVQSLTS
jgi:hypothetical protein